MGGLLADTGERYLSKAHNEEWLKEQGYLEEPTAPLMTILRAKERTIPGVITIDIAAKVREAADMMRQYNVSQLPVMDTGILVGSLREEILMKAMHVGQEPDPRTGAVTPPLYLTSTYSRKTQDQYAYARGANPTRDALQNSLAGLEGAKYALSFSSGMGAITTSLTLLKKGDHVVVTDDCYGGVYRIFTRILSKYGIESTFVDLRDLVDAEDAFRPETRMLWTESPTNPLMKVVDLRELAVIAEAIAKFLKAHKAVAKVHYPGLPDDPGHAIAKKQMRRFGGMLSFEVRDPSRIVERFKRLEVIVPAESLGGVESLIEHPASMTHASVPKEQGEKQGITDGPVRISIQLDDVQDLAEDLERALG